MAQKTSKPKRFLFWILLVICIGYGLVHVPGTYTIDDFLDEYELNSPEGIALLALSDVSLSATLYFENETRHRISRNAEVLVPADTTLQASTSMIPFIRDEEVVARPKTLILSSDQPLTFVYRFVTVAKANTLEIQPNDPEEKVKAIGHYTVLSALATAYRYKRQKELSRDYQAPTRSRMSLNAKVLPNHEIKTEDGYRLFTGSKPCSLVIENAQWIEGTWQRGSLTLALHLADLNPLIAQLVNDLFPEKIEVGGILDLKVKEITNLRFTENFLSLYVKGSLGSAQSKRMANIFTPSFKSHLGIQFNFPRDILLSEAKAGVELKNIYSLDFNRSNPVFDKYIRDLARSYREEAQVSWDLGKEFPILNDLPGQIYIEQFGLTGDEQGFPTFEAHFELKPRF
jgi:hypothetical protein